MAPGAKFPVSMTEGFYDSSYALMLKESYVTVSHFRLTYRNFTLSRLAPPKRVDLTDTLTKIVAASRGDAVVNLRITGGGSELSNRCLCCVGGLSGLLTLGFIVPAQAEAHVEGDVVRLIKTGSVNGGGPTGHCLRVQRDRRVVHLHIRRRG
jgi:hypothetical protein